MNKSHIVNEVAEVVATKKQAQAAVDCVFDTITKTLKNNGSVSIAGFGTFKTASRQARTGRNPGTGEEIQIKAKNIPKFAPGKSLKEAVNEVSP
jgi:DNA-binding protein HU-beta